MLTGARVVAHRFHFHCVEMDEQDASSITAYCCDMCQAMGMAPTRSESRSLPLPVSSATVGSSASPGPRATVDALFGRETCQVGGDATYDYRSTRDLVRWTLEAVPRTRSGNPRFRVTQTNAVDAESRNSEAMTSLFPNDWKRWMQGGGRVSRSPSCTPSPVELAISPPSQSVAHTTVSSPSHAYPLLALAILLLPTSNPITFEPELRALQPSRLDFELLGRRAGRELS